MFFSFHYKIDAWRAAQIRNAGVVEGDAPLSDNDWEKVTKGGDTAIQKWIDGQMAGKSCAVILIGNQTAGRKWIKYEIAKAWNDRKGLVGIYIHHLKDINGNQALRGRNPLDDVSLEGVPLSKVVKAYDPPYKTSTTVYEHITSNIAAWIEEAVRIRGKY